MARAKVGVTSIDEVIEAALDRVVEAHPAKRAAKRHLCFSGGEMFDPFGSRDKGSEKLYDLLSEDDVIIAAQGWLAYSDSEVSGDFYGRYFIVLRVGTIWYTGTLEINVDGTRKYDSAICWRISKPCDRSRAAKVIKDYFQRKTPKEIADSMTATLQGQVGVSVAEAIPWGAPYLDG